MLWCQYCMDTWPSPRMKSYAEFIADRFAQMVNARG